MLGRAWGIGRSLAMYHGIPGRQRRMARLYVTLVVALVLSGAIAWAIDAPL